MADTIKSIYNKLDEERSTIVDKAVECAELTIPSVLTDTDHKEDDDLTTPYQSLGSRAVNNLASKLLLALLPPNSPFFRFVPDRIALMEAEEREPGITNRIRETLTDYENSLASVVEREGIRIQAFHMFKLLIISGNALVFKQKDKGIKVYDLTQYVVKRDGSGKVIEIIVKEMIHRTSLPESVQSQLDNDDNYKSFDLYTKISLNDEGKYEVSQEVEEIEIIESAGVYTEDNLPWMVLRWTSVSNENYGRGLVEQYIGDLRSLEGLTQAIVEGAAASSKVLFMVNTMGTTKAKDLANASNGAIIQGNANDVTTLQVQKAHDMTIAYNVQNDIQRRLSAAFLMTESARRDSERTTAYEIQVMASELEDALGGIYSILSLSQRFLRLFLEKPYFLETGLFLTSKRHLIFALMSFCRKVSIETPS